MRPDKILIIPIPTIREDLSDLRSYKPKVLRRRGGGYGERVLLPSRTRGGRMLTTASGEAAFNGRDGMGKLPSLVFQHTLKGKKAVAVTLA
jgi:hypothetical protein